MGETPAAKLWFIKRLRRLDSAAMRTLPRLVCVGIYVHNRPLGPPPPNDSCPNLPFMLTIQDEELFRRHQRSESAGGQLLTRGELGLAMLLFGCVGAVTWAIRGTDGWNGIDGTIVPGLTWGVLWWYLCRRKGIDARGIPLWLGLGIAIGGEWGYGQYVSWIRGIFDLDGEDIGISPWVGYLGFFVCGISWGATGGISLGWALGPRRSVHSWLIRAYVPLLFALSARLLIQSHPEWFFPNWERGLYTLLPEDAPARLETLRTQATMFTLWGLGLAVIAAGWLLSEKLPIKVTLRRAVLVVEILAVAALFGIVGDWVFFPNDALGMFGDDLPKNLQRAVYTNSQNSIVLLWWIGALFVAALQRDRATLVAGSLIAIGFGFGFTLAALWCLGYGYAPKFIDWWKLWELNAGFYLGVLYVLVCRWAMSQLPQISASREATVGLSNVRDILWSENLLAALGVFAAVYVTGRWDFLVIAILLGLIYVAAMLFITFSPKTQTPAETIELRRRLSFAYSVYLLLFITTWGATSRLAVFLELADPKEVDQYAWPASRIWLFAPVGALLTALILLELARVLRGQKSWWSPEKIPPLIFDLITFLGVIGALTIWPKKIAVIYAVMIAVAVFALTRLNRRFDRTDADVIERAA